MPQYLTVIFCCNHADLTTALRKPCVEISSKFNVNVRVAAETIVRMMRVKNNKGAIKAAKSSDNLAALSLTTSQPSFGNFWKRKLKFKQVTWNEYWRFCDINPTAVDLASKHQVPEVIRAVILNEPDSIPEAIHMSAAANSNRALSDAPAGAGGSSGLFDIYPPIHVAAILGRVECAMELLRDNESGVSAKDSFGKTALFRAARNGQLGMLPTLLKSAAKGDQSVVEALRVAFAPAILQHYDVELLTTIFTEVVRCGFDLEGIAKELQDLHTFLSKTAGALVGTTGSNSMIFHIAKAIAAMKLARQEHAGLSGASTASPGMTKISLGMISSKSTDKMGSPRKAKESPRKPEYDAAKELGLSPETFEPTKRRTSSTDGGFRLRGYFTELAQSLQATSQPLNPELQRRVIEQIAEAVGTSSRTIHPVRYDCDLSH